MGCSYPSLRGCAEKYWLMAEELRSRTRFFDLSSRQGLFWKAEHDSAVIKRGYVKLDVINGVISTVMSLGERDIYLLMKPII